MKKAQWKEFEALIGLESEDDPSILECAMRIANEIKRNTKKINDLKSSLENDATYNGNSILEVIANNERVESIEIRKIKDSKQKLVTLRTKDPSRGFTGEAECTHIAAYLAMQALKKHYAEKEGE